MATLHQRSLSHPHSKKPLPKSRPAPLLKRGTSHTAGKGVHKGQRREEEDEVMATSFLQYCTTCEKQIIVPNNLILYCSESCRKQDQNQASVYKMEQSPPPTPFEPFTFDDLPARDIVPPRSPTTIPSQRSSVAFSEATSEDDVYYRDEMRPKLGSRNDSEAARYLRQFQSTVVTTETSVQRSRPVYYRSPPSMAALSAAPSLSHTPASTVSMSIPYTPSNRPLPSRANPHSSSYGTRSDALVRPTMSMEPSTLPSSFSQYSLKSQASFSTTIDTVEGAILYEKKSTIAASPGESSLKQLFAFGAMQGAPARSQPK